MLKMLDGPEQDERDFLMPECSASDDESTKLNELSFPWPLINAIKELRGFFQLKTKFSTQLLFSFEVQLLIVFIISMLCIIFGSVFLNGCHRERMLCNVFIIQGVCGLFAVLVHVWKITSGYEYFHTTDFFV